MLGCLGIVTLGPCACILQGVLPGGGAALLHASKILPALKESLPNYEQRVGLQIIADSLRVCSGFSPSLMPRSEASLHPALHRDTSAKHNSGCAFTRCYGIPLCSAHRFTRHPPLFCSIRILTRTAPAQQPTRQIVDNAGSEGIVVVGRLMEEKDHNVGYDAAAGLFSRNFRDREEALHMRVVMWAFGA